MKNIHLIPTDKPSRLQLNVNTKTLILFNNIQSNNESAHLTTQNIFITSDEEIKEGDWFIFGVNESVLRMLEAACKANIKYNGAKKIILTTDQGLIKDGVQAIDDEFLEWFVKNPSCEEVEVESGLFFYRDGEDIRYKIIIPKQEPKKVLTEEDIFNQKDIDAVTDYINKEQQKQHLIDMMESDEELELYDESREIKLKDVFNDEKKENIKKFIDEIENPSEPNKALIDAARRYIAGDNYNRYYDDFIEDAKWQQERMYSEEEVIKILYQFHYDLVNSNFDTKEEWFEQFKNK